MKKLAQHKIESKEHLLPDQGVNGKFQAARSADGTILRDKTGAYFDTQGNRYELSKDEKTWHVSNPEKNITYIRDVATPANTSNPIETTLTLDATPQEKPGIIGCGHKDPEWDKPTILTHPMPEITKPEPLITPIPKIEKPELPGCGGRDPLLDAINKLPGGCGGLDVIQQKPEDFILHAKQEQAINEAFIGATFDTSEAASPNAQANLDKKLRLLEKSQGNAAKVETLPDGRIRYYTKESLSKTPGQTRGASYVTEYNPNTGQVRGWNECYDQAGNVNRVHPKFLDGQDLTGQHYPPTKAELELFQMCQEGQI